MLQRNTHFWTVGLVRGLFALLTGSCVLILPDMARSLLAPLAIATSVLGLAIYGVIDSGLILVSSFMAGSRATRVVLLLQGMSGIVIGLLLLFAVFDRVRLEWFLTLAAAQAISAGIGEIVVARHAGTRAIIRWNDTAAGVALCVGFTYLALRVLYTASFNPNRISWLIYGYLVAFGLAQCMTAGRMLFSRDRDMGVPQIIQR